MKNNSFGVTKLIVSVLIFHLNRCGAICIFKKIRGFYPRTPALPRTPASRGSGVWAPAAPKPGTALRATKKKKKINHDPSKKGELRLWIKISV